jgi:hypothetical protein
MYEALIDKNNNDEIKVDAREAFKVQEADKAEEWRRKGRKEEARETS